MLEVNFLLMYNYIGDDIMNVLKKLRKDNHYSYNDMANFLNISKTFYWQIENEKRRLSYQMALMIANIFKLKPDDIFYDDFKSKEF